MSLETEYFPAARIITNTPLPILQRLKGAQSIDDSDIDQASRFFEIMTNALISANLEISGAPEMIVSPRKRKIYLGSITAKFPAQRGAKLRFSAHLIKLDSDKYSIDLVAKNSLDTFCAEYSKRRAALNNIVFKEILDRAFQALDEATVAYATRTHLPFIPPENSDAKSLTQDLLHAPYLQFKVFDGTVELPELDSFSRQNNGEVVVAHTPKPGATFVYYLEDNTTVPHYRELAFLLNRMGVTNFFYRLDDAR